MSAALILLISYWVVTYNIELCCRVNLNRIKNNVLFKKQKDANLSVFDLDALLKVIKTRNNWDLYWDSKVSHEDVLSSGYTVSFIYSSTPELSRVPVETDLLPKSRRISRCFLPSPTLLQLPTSIGQKLTTEKIYWLPYHGNSSSGST